MRELWLQIGKNLPVSLKKKLLKASAKTCSGVLVKPADVEIAKKAGVKILADALRKELRSKEDLDDLVLQLSIPNKTPPSCVIVSCPDWKVIPLENLIAALHGKSKLLAEVTEAKEARIALEALELGVDGVVLKTRDASELTEVSKIVREVKTRVVEKEEALKLELVPAKIVAVKPVATGARACIDTCDLMVRGEGMLIGSQSSGLFLVQAEVEESPHVAPRPFRVNAGSISLYALTPGDKTKYLSELKAGDEVLIVNKHGKTRSAVIGRVKIEWRPLALIEAEIRGRRIKTILQNAETIRLVTPDGSKSVSELKPRDKVLVRLEEGGRHFGTVVKEESVLEL